MATLETITAAAIGGGGSSYLVYSNNLTQSGTSAPTGTPNQNTLGENITLTYSGVAGIYTLDDMSGNGSFGTAGKCEIFINQTAIPDALFRAFYVNDNQVEVRSYENNGDGSWSLANSYLSNTSIEIRVYP